MLLAGAANMLPLGMNALMIQRIGLTLFALGTASTVFSLLMVDLFLLIYAAIYPGTR